MTTNIRRYQQVSKLLEDGVQPFAITYNLVGLDFGTPNGPFEINGPAGKDGKVVAIHAHNVTEAFAVDTTEGLVHVGVSGTVNAYAISSNGVTDNAAISALLDYDLGVGEGTLGNRIPADTAVIVTPIAGVDAGAEAGICTVSVTILWV